MGGGASSAKKYETDISTQKPVVSSTTTTAPPPAPVAETIAAAPAEAPAKEVTPAHVAIIGAGFVGTATAFAMVCHETVAKVTLTDVNEKKCLGEVLDLEDAAIGNRVEMATAQEAGRADIIVVTAGRGQKEGETRLDLIKANSGIMRSVINSMKPIKPSAKIIVVSNPCDALTYVAQECSGLPISQVFGSGTVLDTKRLCVGLGQKIGVSSGSVTLFVLGEHGDSQFPAASLGNVGGVPLLQCKSMQSVNLAEEAKKSSKKAYSIIDRKGYTAFGVGRAVEEIVECILKDKNRTLPVSVRVPGKNCCLSLPCVVGFHGIERILEHVTEHLTDVEASLYNQSIRSMQIAAGNEPDVASPLGRAGQSGLDLLATPVTKEAGSAQPEIERRATVVPLASDHRLSGTHVAVVGAGFVGTYTAFALLCTGTAAKITLTDVNVKKCEGEVLDLEDGNGCVEMATPEEAGQADVIVITAGRGQKDGETRLDLIKANAGIMQSVVNGMKPIKESAKIIVVSNPCDALTYVAQECAGLPLNQVFGSGTVLDSRRLRSAISKKVGVHLQSVNLFVLGEHGDSQFPAASLANIGGVPLNECNKMKDVDLMGEAKASGAKAYSIIEKKGYTAFGIAMAVVSIVQAVLKDEQRVLPVSTRIAGRTCCLSLPCVVGIHGIERDLEHVSEYFAPKEKELYEASLQSMEEVAKSIEIKS